MKKSSNSEVSHTLFFCFVLLVVLGLPSFYMLYVSGFWVEFLNLDLNEKGDTLAGIFGSLAFVSATIAIILQSFELRAQREELRLTRNVMDEQKKATQEMANSMAVQADIFADEQMQRAENRNDIILEQKVRLFIDMATYYRDQLEFQFSVSGLTVKSRDEVVVVTQTSPTVGKIFLLRETLDKMSLETVVQKISEDIFYVQWLLERIEKADFIIVRKPRNPKRLQELISAIRDIMALEPTLGDAGKTRLFRLRIARIDDYLNKINDSQVWGEVDG
ncbi:hypothetical protein OS189_09380 [Sulfitobacter sp. F26169L]|uniref:hypothetical protein n=1 Tax=Sulfitobacter sp. F26169L TaxID=2996015 RepID=UPI002260D2F7|nr:hypothetical protein [Sulfitobacter sp. F26169L]MCX7566550.1 hypothetical protein [Sulfitobacter sp. F26169L]